MSHTLTRTMEREAYEIAFAYGHGWSHRYCQGRRYTVACGLDQYRVRYGYVAVGYILSRDEFHQELTAERFIFEAPVERTPTQ